MLQSVTTCCCSVLSQILRPYLLSEHGCTVTFQLHITLTCEYFDLGAVTSLIAKSPVEAGSGFYVSQYL